MEPVRAEITFVDPQDDTTENAEVVELVEERARMSRADDRDLDELIGALGFEASDFQQR
jgi:hypothetical protein